MHSFEKYSRQQNFETVLPELYCTLLEAGFFWTVLTIFSLGGGKDKCQNSSHNFSTYIHSMSPRVTKI